MLASMVLTLVAAPGLGQPRYREPIQVDGMVFPLARSTWFSVINFADDWHVPRFRKTEGKWELTGRHEGNDIFAEPEGLWRQVLRRQPGTLAIMGLFPDNPRLN